MGSSGKKPRKGKKPQHLAKVGTHTNHQAAERRAVAENMGLGGAAPWLRVTLMVIAFLVVAGAIFSLAFWWL